MKNNRDWNPDLYLKYMGERTQPSIDLISKINISFQPKSVLDIGCGPGNSSQALLVRWPATFLTGIDSSPNMIQKATASYPGNKWIVADVSIFAFNETFDVVFSNATIQWIPDHKNLFKKLFSLINPGGVLAIQVPRFNEMPLSAAINKILSKGKWSALKRQCSDIFTFHDYKYYYDLINEDYKSVDFWQTEYIHVLESQYSIIEWMRSTGMKPYLDCLTEEEKPKFEDEVLIEIKRDYPHQNDGRVLFPFKRLFMIGYK